MQQAMRGTLAKLKISASWEPQAGEDQPGREEACSAPRSDLPPKRKETNVKITVETNVAAPIQTVWEAYTAPEDIKQWNAASDAWHTTAASVDLREGGTFSSRMEAKDGSMGFDFAGAYTKIIEHQLIEYSFGGRTAQVAFIPERAGVNVRVIVDSETTHSIEQHRDGGRRPSTTSQATPRAREKSEREPGRRAPAIQVGPARI